MQPCPSSTITFKLQNSLQSQCTDPIFLIYYIPDCSKLKHQWFSSIMKDRACCHRSLRITKLTSVKSPFCNPCFPMATSGTAKTIRPTNLDKIFQTSFFAVKTLFKFKNCTRVFFHASILFLVGTGAKCISLLYVCNLFSHLLVEKWVII